MFQLSEKHLEMVENILNQFDLSEYAFVFGSRAKGTAKKFSDLDICITKEITKTDFRKVVDAFEDSNLPIKVDIILWNEIDDNFKNYIQNDLKQFKKSAWRSDQT